MSATELFRLAETVEERYISGRHWRRGKWRTTLNPDPRLKRVQRQIHEKIFWNLPRHPDSYTWRERGIKRAAELHAGRRFLFRSDIRDFYPSITPDRVREGFAAFGLPRSTLWLLTRLVTVHGHVPQGAPTSGGVAEVLLYPLDARYRGFARENHMKYSRYGDDIALSSNSRIGPRMKAKLCGIADDQRIVLHETKTCVAGPDELHTVLKIRVNQKPNVPLHAERMRHRLRMAASGRVELSERDVRSLAGQIGYIKFIDPDRGRKLQEMLNGLQTDDKG
jgi:hypothetical protein